MITCPNVLRCLERRLNGKQTNKIHSRKKPLDLHPVSAPLRMKTHALAVTHPNTKETLTHFLTDTVYHLYLPLPTTHPHTHTHTCACKLTLFCCLSSDSIKAVGAKGSEPVGQHYKRPQNK